MIAFAVGFGLIAVFLANTWLNNRAAEQMRNLEAQQNATTPAFTIVVASRPLRFGDELSAVSLREIAWPQNAPPAGSFSKISELTSAKRIVLAPIDVNEPILASKITGPGQRATLSAMLNEDCSRIMPRPLTPVSCKAVTIRVDDVADVAGFVLPGDRVDVVLTRPRENKGPITNVVLENARVLGVDQLADQRVDKPSVVKAVTLEVDEVDGQKLALASRVGSMSLLLRKAGDRREGDGRELTQLDLTQYVTPTANLKFRTLIVTRPSAVGTQRDEYSVPMDVSDSQAAAVSEERVVHN
jgi:pilus assembly protein CpaB